MPLLDTADQGEALGFSQQEIDERCITPTQAAHTPTPTPTKPVSVLPSTGEGESSLGADLPRAILLAAAGLLLLAAAGFTARRGEPDA